MQLLAILLALPAASAANMRAEQTNPSNLLTIYESTRPPKQHMESPLHTGRIVNYKHGYPKTSYDQSTDSTTGNLHAEHMPSAFAPLLKSMKFFQRDIKSSKTAERLEYCEKVCETTILGFYPTVANPSSSIGFLGSVNRGSSASNIHKHFGRIEKCEKDCNSALATVATGHRAKQKESGDWFQVRGIELIKRDIKNITRVWSFENCQDACEKTRKCESFSYSGAYPTDYCLLKKSAENYLLNADVDSYLKMPSNYQCFGNSDFYGYDFFTTKTSYNDCSKFCNKYNRCNGFTWVLSEHEPLGQCYLKTLLGDHEVSPSNRGAITCRRLA
jgi:hypothetical protein